MGKLSSENLFQIHFEVMTELKKTVRLLKKIESEWIFVHEEGRTDIQSQIVLTHQGDELPMERIQKLWALNKRIVQVSYAEGIYVLILQEDQEQSTNQKIHISKEFPLSTLDTIWNQLRRVVCLGFCKDEWVVVSEDMKGSVLQGIVTTTDDLPTKDIQESWNSNKNVLQLTSYENKWVLLLESSTRGGQSYAGNSDWPDDKIQEKYSKGFYITSVAFNKEVGAWSVIFDKSCESNLSKQCIERLKDFPESKLKELGITRYGTRFL